MAPKGHGVGYRKSNSLRKAPGEEDSPITIGKRELSGREEGMFLDVAHGRCLECEAETEGEFSLVFGRLVA